MIALDDLIPGNLIDFSDHNRMATFALSIGGVLINITQSRDLVMGWVVSKHFQRDRKGRRTSFSVLIRLNDFLIYRYRRGQNKRPSVSS